jgi:type IV secretory pathway TrbD component
MSEPTPIVAPSWFTMAAVGVLLWELVGCAMYLMQVSVDPALLPVDERNVWEAAPAWMTAAYGVAVWGGLAGAILLILRRKHAAPVLLVSFIAVLVQFSALLLVPTLRELMTSDMLLLPFLIAVVCFLVWRFAHHAKSHGWIQ